LLLLEVVTLGLLEKIDWDVDEGEVDDEKNALLL
jgi:hypothetical protein